MTQLLRGALLTVAAVIGAVIIGGTETTVAQRPGPQFAAISIRRDPPEPPRAGQMFACHGIDGYRRALFGRFDPAATPQGRCAGSGVRLVYLIGLAYEVLPEFVSGGPDWIYGGRGPLPPSQISFTIQAAAETPSTATTEDLGQMLRSMLADRFRLQFRWESKVAEGYKLVVAQNGSRLNESTDPEEPPFMGLNEKGRLAIQGKSRLSLLAQLLTRYVPRSGDLPRPVVDRTGLTGAYDYEILFPQPAAGQRGATPDQGSVPDVSGLLEDQLGLRLERAQIPFELLIVDNVEYPSPN